MRSFAPALLVLIACGPKADGDGASSSGAQSDDDGATSNAIASSTTDASTSSSSSSSTGEQTTEPIKMDAGTDPTGGMSVACASDRPVPNDLQIVTPVGELAVESAFWAWNWCCTTAPILVMRGGDPFVIPNGGSFPYYAAAPIVTMLPDGSAHRGAWTGEVAMKLWTSQDGEYAHTDWDFPATILDTVADTDPDHASELLDVTFDIDQNGWQLSGAVTASYCPALEQQACPCE